MRKIKRTIAAFIISVIVVMIPLSVFGAPRTEECTANLIQAGDFDINYDRDYSDFHKNFLGVSTYDVNMSDVEKRLEERIIQALNERWTSINFYLNEGLSRAWAMTMYSDVINDHPEFFYVSHNYGIEYTFSTVTKIVPHYLMNAADTATAKEKFNAGVNRAIAQVDSSMNDLQKALTIHDYICSNATFTDDELDSAHSAWGFFNNGHIVCAGYALTYSYLMNKVGVQCEMITSIKLSHGWNAVKIDGVYYNVDCSWDDAASSIYGYSDNKVNHGNFLKSESVFSVTHKKEGDSYDADTFDDCVRTDTRYDSGAFWEDKKISIPVINGKYYYLKPDFKLFQVSLYERDKNGAERKIGGNYYADYNSYTNTSFLYAYITKFKDKLYINCGNSSRGYYVYCVDPKNGARYEVTRIPSTPMGIGIEPSDQNIFYQLKNSESQYHVLDRKNFFSDNISTGDGKYNPYPDVNNDNYVNAKDYMLLFRS